MKNDCLWIMKNSAISEEDQAVLSLLYQPLIGTEAHGLYLLLSNLTDKKNHQSEIVSFSFLLDLLNIKEKAFLSARQKLEAIGLINIYQKKDIYLFKLNMPLSPKQFFLDGILGSFLRSEIGDKNFNMLFELFSVPEVSKDGYENITKTFDEVFQVNNLEALTTNKHVFGRKNGTGVVIKDEFDFEVLYEALPIRIKKKRLYTEKIKSQIASIFYVYGFSIEEMVRILSDSYIEDNKSIFYEKISLNAKMYNEQKNGNHSIEIDMKEQKSTNPLVLSKLKPQEIIRAYGSKLTNQSFALETIRNLVERNAVDIAVINAVIIAALRSKNDLPSLNYLEKVLNDWIKRGIDNEEAAYHYIMGDSSGTKPKTNKTNYASNRVVKHVPDWVNDFIDSMETGETKHD